MLLTINLLDSYLDVVVAGQASLRTGRKVRRVRRREVMLEGRRCISFFTKMNDN